MKILHVDDEPPILEQAEIFLEKEVEGLDVETATSAKKGLDLLERNNYDCIVADYQMPEMDGLKFLETVRNDLDSDIPFIVFTGKGREEVAIKALNLGADRYLQKGGSPKSQYGVLAQAIVQEVKHAKVELEREKVEAKLSSLVKGSKEPIYIVDENCRITFANQAELEKTKMKRGEIIGSKFGESHPEEDPEEFRRKVEKALDTGMPQKQEVQHEKEGKYYDRTLSPIENPRTDEIDKVAVISNDVTELKEREKELREREERFRKLFENQVNGFAIFESVFDGEGNFVSYRFVDINPAYERITGVDREEVKGKDIQEVFPGTEDSWIEAYGSVATTGESKTFEMYHGPTDKHYLCNVFRPWDTEDRFCVAFNDITERKEMEKELRKSEERYRRLFETAQDGMLILNAESGEIKDANPFIRDILGYSKEELVGRELWQIGAFRDIAENKEKFEELVDEGYIRYEDLPLETKEGKEVPVEFVSNTYEAGGEKVLQCNIREISERKKREEELEESRERFESAIEEAPFPIMLHVEDGEIVGINDTWTDITGYSQGEIPTISDWVEKAYGSRKDEVMNVIESLHEKKGKTSEGEFEINTKDKEDRIWDFKSVNIGELPDGRSLVMSMATDITERKEATRKLRERIERDRKIFENLGDAVFVISLSEKDYGEIMEVNKAALQQTGFSREELIGKDIHDLVAEISGEEDIETVRKKLLEGKTVKSTILRKRKDEDTYWVEEIIVPFEHEGKNAAISVSRDITERKEREKELQKEKKRFQEIFNNANDAIYLHELTEEGMPSNFIEVNDVACEMLGYSREEFLEMSPRDIDSSKKSNEVPEVMEELFEEGDVRFEMIHQAKDGTEIPVEIHSHLFELEGEKRVLSVARDISERREAQETLEHLVQSISEVAGYKLFDSVVEELSEWFDLDGAFIGRIQGDGKTVSALSMTLDGEKIEDYEYKLPGTPCQNVTKEGPRLWRENILDEFPGDEELEELDVEGYLGIPIQDEDEGPLGVLWGVSRDKIEDIPSNWQDLLQIIASRVSTEILRIERENALEKSRTRLEDAMEEGNLAWWEMELPSGKVQFNNRKAEMLGYSSEEFDHYTDFTDLIHPEDHDRAMEAMRNHLEGREEMYEVEYRIEKKDGGYKWFRDVGGITEEGEDDYRKVTGVVIDIDDRKRAKEREDFLHSLLRHDLRNKLQVSLGYGQLLKEEGLSEEQEEIVGKDWKAKQEAIDLIGKVKKIREAYDEEVGKIELEQVLQTSVEKYGHEASNKDINISLGECDYTVKGGEFLDEVFSNLIINAIKHSQGSEIRVRTIKSDDKITVIVEDDGKGVPEEEKEKILEKGYSKGSGGGSGLGLYFVREITRSYGGNIEIKDSELGGARFDVELKKV